MVCLGRLLAENPRSKKRKAGVKNRELGPQLCSARICPRSRRLTCVSARIRGPLWEERDSAAGQRALRSAGKDRDHHPCRRLGLPAFSPWRMTITTLGEVPLTRLNGFFTVGRGRPACGGVRRLFRGDLNRPGTPTVTAFLASVEHRLTRFAIRCGSLPPRPRWIASVGVDYYVERSDFRSRSHAQTRFRTSCGQRGPYSAQCRLCVNLTAGQSVKQPRAGSPASRARVGHKVSSRRTDLRMNTSDGARSVPLRGTHAGARAISPGPPYMMDFHKSHRRLRAFSGWKFIAGT